MGSENKRQVSVKRIILVTLACLIFFIPPFYIADMGSPESGVDPDSFLLEMLVYALPLTLLVAFFGFKYLKKIYISYKIADLIKFTVLWFVGWFLMLTLSMYVSIFTGDLNVTF